MREKYELLVVMSDQHSGQTCGFAGDPVARTPNLDSIAAQGVVFSEAYTSCPLCVPARASFLTGRFPFRVGVGGNEHAIASHEPTFAHCLSLGGYETTLIGRMHMNGLDQLHGFERRIGKDICTIMPGMCFTGEPGLQFDYSGAQFHKVWPAEHCASWQYDEYVAAHALEFFRQKHEAPQAVVVGTYMPHMPLGGTEEQMAYYRPLALQTLKERKLSFPCDYLGNRGGFTEDQEAELIECRAAYYSMIEAEDELIGRIYRAYREYLGRKDAKGIFVYVSDHGDHMGDKARIGKQTFFERSAKIPMVIAGDDILPQRVDTPVSLLDLTATLCAVTGSPKLPLGDGVDLSPALFGGSIPARPIFSELMGKGKTRDSFSLGLMVRDGNEKFISYQGYEDQDLLFDLSEDPEETVNLASARPERVKELSELLKKHAQGYEVIFPKLCENGQFSPNNRLLTDWGQKHPHSNDHATWIFQG